jgi:hypothetical protein
VHKRGMAMGDCSRSSAVDFQIKKGI